MLGSERILALDIGASTVKVGEFQASKGQGLRLTNFNFADLGIDPEHSFPDHSGRPMPILPFGEAISELLPV